MPGVEKTMREFKAGRLHSGSSTGPLVTNPKQAIAIALNNADENDDVIKSERFEANKRQRKALQNVR